MARVCVFEIVSLGVPRSSDNAEGLVGMSCVSRVLLPNAGFQIPALWKNKTVPSKTRIWRHKSLFLLQGRTWEGCRHRLMSALNDDLGEYKGITNYGPGKTAYETFDYMHDEDSMPAVEDRTLIESPSAEPSRSSSDQIDVESTSSSTGPSAFNNGQIRIGNECSPNAPSGNSERVSYFSGSDGPVFLNSGDHDSTKSLRVSAIESNGSLFDGSQGNDGYFMESGKPAYVSLVWEAGSKIEGVTSDMKQERIEPNEQNLSLIIDDDYRERKKLMELEEILSTFPKSEEELNRREAELLAYTDKLLTQAKMNQEAYVSSQEALSTAEEMIFQLQTQVDDLKDEVASRDHLLRLLKKEGMFSSQSLQRAAEALSDAEKRLVELESQVHIGEEILVKERTKLTAALKTAGLHELALRVAELKVGELTSELVSLKESFGAAGGAEQLSMQVKTLEHELRSRDRLLLEIKEETMRSTEALKLAAQIKQDLNATRHRELHLTQSLEAAYEKIKELEEQSARNARAARAEQVLKQTQKMLSEAKGEMDILHQGVEARDKAINIMKDEVDMNIALLSNAARDREELRKINRYVGELKMELESRDAKLSMMREEMALIINLAKKRHSTTPRPTASQNLASPSSPSASSASFSSPVQEPRPKRKNPVQKSGETGPSTTPVRKPHGARQSTRSPPQTS